MHNRHNLDFLQPFWGVKCDYIPFLCLEKRPSERRLPADSAARDVDLIYANNRVRALTAVFVPQRNSRAELDVRDFDLKRVSAYQRSRTPFSACSHRAMRTAGALLTLVRGHFSRRRNYAKVL